MNMQESAARAKDSARALRPLNGTSNGEISVLAVRHILGFPDGRSYPPDPAALSAWAIGASDGGPR